MYLSHPVRRMRDDPTPGEEVRLVVESDQNTDRSALTDALRAVGARIEQDLAFGAVLISIDQESIDDLCALERISSIETDDVIGVGGDAGEDIDPV